MSTENHLLQAAETYAKEILGNHNHENLKFHTLRHTEQVVEAAEIIAGKSGVPIKEIELIKIAAWFHDLGYTQIYQGHEQVSKQMAMDFLLGRGLEPITINHILGMIEATRLDVQPNNLYEEIIKDADLFNLATPEALDYTRRLRIEWREFCNKKFDDITWYRLNLDFYNSHVYHTDYAKSHFSQDKNKNIELLEEKLKKAEARENPDHGQMTPEGGWESSVSLEKKKVKTPEKVVRTSGSADQKFKKKDLKKLLDKSEKQVQKLNEKVERLKELRPDRGIETMFRTTYRTHISLSSIADNKANILLSINAIIISIVSSSLIRQVEDHPLMIYPSIILLTVCMATIIFAILATRPKVNSGIFTREDIEEKRTNLLFFGNFHRMPLPDYQWGIKEMMKDSNYLYGSMAKDIYFLGVVLAKKFQLLRIAYTIFMYGMVIVVVTFGLTFWFEAKGF